MKIFIFCAFFTAFIAISSLSNLEAAQTKQAQNSLDAYAPFEELLQITPSNSTTYSPPLRGCFVEVAGDVAILTTKSAAAVTITAVAGQLIPAMITQVKTSTTATVVCGR